MDIQEISLEQIKPYKLNAKKHPAKQIDGIVESIKRFGFTQPVVVDGKGTIIIGHGRVEAAKKAGLDKVPCVRREDLNDQEAKALRILDNRIAETGWDPDMLSLDLESLEIDLGEFNLDFPFLAKSMDGEKGLIDENMLPGDVPDKDSKAGDVWILGKHRLMCGDSTNQEHVEKLFNGVVPGLMVTDPPYGVNYDPEWRDGKDKGLGIRKTGKVLNDDRVDWSEAFNLFKGDIAYVWHASLHAAEAQVSLEKAGFRMRSQIIWAKQHFAISQGHYHWQHEPCWYAVKKGSKAHWVGDRKQTTLWHAENSNAFGGKKDDKSTNHGTQKPVEIMRRPILNHTNEGQAVYDPFLGSGTTLIAAQQTGRVCFGMEISPEYVAIAVKRWEEFTGEKAIKETQSGPVRKGDHSIH